MAFPNDSEEVKDLLKGKTTELQDKAAEALTWAQVQRCTIQTAHDARAGGIVRICLNHNLFPARNLCLSSDP